MSRTDGRGAEWRVDYKDSDLTEDESIYVYIIIEEIFSDFEHEVSEDSGGGISTVFGIGKIRAKDIERAADYLDEAVTQKIGRHVDFHIELRDLDAQPPVKSSRGLQRKLPYSPNPPPPPGTLPPPPTMFEVGRWITLPEDRPGIPMKLQIVKIMRRAGEMAGRLGLVSYILSDGKGGEYGAGWFGKDLKVWPIPSGRTGTIPASKRRRFDFPMSAVTANPVGLDQGGRAVYGHGGRFWRRR